LKPLLDRVAEIYDPVAEDGGHPFQANLAAKAEVYGDAELLFQMFANLVENAIHHTPPGSSIALTLELTPEGPLVCIADHGFGVPVNFREKILRRFFRLETSRNKPGYGLGLALVSAIADLHDATLELLDNEPGLKCEVHFHPRFEK
jgi:signal transduction histidine kinase